MEAGHTVGGVYFMLSYLDDDSLVPCMDTVVYLGTENDGTPECRHIFQDFESWKDRGAFPDTTEGPGKVFKLPEGELSNIHRLEGAMDELHECLPRRKARGLD